jgi:chemotaxis signal transduction protein
VFELGRVLGRVPTGAAPPTASGQHIAVTGDDRGLIGWLADRIVRTPQSDVTDVVPLPRAVGGLGAAWFEAVVKVSERSVLLLAPRQLYAPTPWSNRHDTTPAFAPRPSAGKAADPMVMVFTSPALPKCAARHYALSARQIVAVVKSIAAMPVPGSAPHVVGIAWWRRTIVPLVDFRSEAERTAAPGARFVIAQCAGRLRDPAVAFPIDAETTLHRATGEQRQLTSVTRPAFAAGLFEIDGRPLALLDLDNMVVPPALEAEDERASA